MNDNTSPRFAAKPTRTSMPDWYPELLDSVATHITTGRRRAVSAANAELLATNVRTAMPDEGPDLAQQATRDPYLFDFVGTPEKARERELEQGLIDHIGKFLVELGQGFAFVGRQVRLELAGDEFYCDLLFYHLELRCFVVIELKSVRFDPAFLGQLNLYTAVVDDVLAKPGDKPTIGLLLCRSKNDVVAEYALRGYRVPPGVSEWVTAANESLPKEVASVLPSVAELEAELAAGPEEL
jgi:predicted nuclease of restriction endonuclease-like (RecB) superfamily